MSQNVTTRLVTAADLPRIAALHGRVFGPGRFVRSAYRVREGKGLISRFCRVAMLGGKPVATLRITDIAVGGTQGAALLGPLAVDPDFAGQGYGRRLVSEALDEMKHAGVKLVVLVGDEPYYGRFGFAPVAPGHILLPGPVNPQRILAVELEAGALQSFRGLVVAEPRDGDKAEPREKDSAAPPGESGSS